MIVTAIDEPFFPALVALRNSVRMHSSATKIACLTYGDADLARRVEALGIEVRHNVDINAALPPGDRTDEGCKPMYARLMAPLMFENCAWFDADQIVQKNINCLFEMQFDEPLAAVAAERDIQSTVIGMTAPEGNSIYSGLMRFNSDAWRRERVTERCLELMNKPGVYWKFVVQSVLSVVLAGKFRRLDAKWQGFANRNYRRLDEAYVLHWHGRTMKPWTHPAMPNAEIWRGYYECMSS